MRSGFKRNLDGIDSQTRQPQRPHFSPLRPSSAIRRRLEWHCTRCDRELAIWYRIVCRRARQVLSPRSWTHLRRDSRGEEVSLRCRRAVTRNARAPFRGQRSLCLPRCARGRAVDSFSFVLLATKILRLEKGTDWSRSAIHWYFMLEYRYVELIPSIPSENVSDPESRVESIVTASLDVPLQITVILWYYFISAVCLRESVAIPFVLI